MKNSINIELEEEVEKISNEDERIASAFIMLSKSTEWNTIVEFIKKGRLIEKKDECGRIIATEEDKQRHNMLVGSIAELEFLLNWPKSFLIKEEIDLEMKNKEKENDI